MWMGVSANWHMGCQLTIPEILPNIISMDIILIYEMLLYNITLTYENPIIRKIQYTKRTSKKFPFHLTKKY